MLYACQVFSIGPKRFRSFFTLLLSVMISASVAVCYCPPATTASHQHSAQKESSPCHEEKSHHDHDGGHETSGHACLCDGGSINGYLNQAEKAPIKIDFLVAVLNQFQRGVLIEQPSFKLLQSTHSPPGESQRLYITHLILLI